MALADRLAALEQTVNKGGCSFGKFLDTLPTDTRQVMDRLLATGISHQQLRAELAAEGHPFSRDTISYHRRGKCPCQAVTR